VADSCITVGVGLLVLSTILRDRKVAAEAKLPPA
jgi:lipoprotein signal peptidase